RDCVVIPIEHNGNAEPCAVLLAANPVDATAQQVVSAANRELAEYQRMHHWLVWPDVDFPRTATGKPKLAQIRAKAHQLLGAGAAGRSQQREKAAPAGATAALSNLLARFLSQSSESTAHLEQNLSLSSLDRVELLSTLEQKFHVELNETAFAEAKTVADVERLMQHPSARRIEYVYPRWAQSAPVRWFRLAVYYALVWPA